jgi:hypothetical protein
MIDVQTSRLDLLAIASATDCPNARFLARRTLTTNDMHAKRQICAA